MTDNSRAGGGIPPDRSSDLVKVGLDFSVSKLMKALDQGETYSGNMDVDCGNLLGNLQPETVSNAFLNNNSSINIQDTANTGAASDGVQPSQQCVDNGKADANQPAGDNNAQNNVNKSDYRYSSLDSGPFVVYVEGNSHNSSVHLNAIKVGGIILTKWNVFNSSIVEIKSIGKNRVKIEFKDFSSANLLVSYSSQLQADNLEAYIPKFLICRKGVIRHVSVDYSTDYLKSNIAPMNYHSRFEIDSVERIERKVVDKTGKTEYKPTQSIIVYFRGQLLPKHVVINKVRCEVELYVQKVLLCYNCYRYGHMAKQCKSAGRCSKCGKSHDRLSACSPEDLDVENVNKCLQCGGNHLVTEITLCPEFSRQKQIKTVMSQTNTSYREVSKTVPRNTYANVVRGNNSNNNGGGVGKSFTNGVSTSERRPYPGQSSRSNQALNLHNSRSFPVTKRARPSSPTISPTMQEHIDIVSKFTLPNTPGGVLSHPSCSGGARNITGLGSGIATDGMVQVIFEVIKLVMESLKTKDSFDIQSTEVLQLVKDKLSLVTHVLPGSNV